VLASPELEEARGLIDAAFHRLSATDSRAVALFPDEVDARMLAQQSVFTIHANKLPLNKQVGAENFLARVLIAREAKESLRQELLALGVKDSSLFPDLEALARDLNRGR
jgi:hypothetical protein